MYHDEGLSLRKYLYTPTRADGAMFYEPSEFWRRLRSVKQRPYNAHLQLSPCIFPQHLTRESTKPRCPACE